MQLIQAKTIAEAWELATDVFRFDVPIRVPTRFGLTFEIPGLTIEVSEPAGLNLPDAYVHRGLVSDYVARLSGQDEHPSLLDRRLRRWPSGTETFNQLDGILELLRRDPGSRSAAFTLWEPAEDLSSDTAVSPVAGSYRVIADKLWHFLVARSVDVYVGLVAELVAFSMIQQRMASELDVAVGPLHYSCWSAHVYEYDFIAYLWQR